MNRLGKYTSAASGMVLLAGLAYYQGNPDQGIENPDSMVGTAVMDTREVDEDAEARHAEEVADVDCDTSQDPENQNSETCDKISQK